MSFRFGYDDVDKVMAKFLVERFSRFEVERGLGRLDVRLDFFSSDMLGVNMDFEFLLECDEGEDLFVCYRRFFRDVFRKYYVERYYGVPFSHALVAPLKGRRLVVFVGTAKRYRDLFRDIEKVLDGIEKYLKGSLRENDGSFYRVRKFVEHDDGDYYFVGFEVESGSREGLKAVLKHFVYPVIRYAVVTPFVTTDTIIRRHIWGRLRFIENVFKIINDVAKNKPTVTYALPLYVVGRGGKLGEFYTVEDVTWRVMKKIEDSGIEIDRNTENVLRGVILAHAISEFKELESRKKTDIIRFSLHAPTFSESFNAIKVGRKELDELIKRIAEEVKDKIDRVKDWRKAPFANPLIRADVGDVLELSSMSKTEIGFTSRKERPTIRGLPYTAYYSPGEKKVVFRKDVTHAKSFSAVIHEFTHAMEDRYKEKTGVLLSKELIAPNAKDVLRVLAHYGLATDYEHLTKPHELLAELMEAYVHYGDDMRKRFPVVYRLAREVVDRFSEVFGEGVRGIFRFGRYGRLDRLARVLDRLNSTDAVLAREAIHDHRVRAMLTKPVSRLTREEKEYLFRWALHVLGKRFLYDLAKKSRKVPRYTYTWIMKPNKTDIPGVDTPERKKEGKKRYERIKHILTS